jgi:hypothetical protein
LQLNCNLARPGRGCQSAPRIGSVSKSVVDTLTRYTRSRYRSRRWRSSASPAPSWNASSRSGDCRRESGGPSSRESQPESSTCSTTRAPWAISRHRRATGSRLCEGDLAGFHSIRINDQWRVIFRWGPAGPSDVDISDYH